MGETQVTVPLVRDTVEGIPPTTKTTSTPPNIQEINSKVAKVAIEAKTFGLSGKAVGAAFVNGDASWFIRTVGVDLPSALGLSTRRDGKISDGYMYQAMGITTAFSSGLGVYGMVKSAASVAHAAQIGDSEGIVDGTLNLATTTAQAVGGTAMLAFRPLSLTSLALGVNASSFQSASLLGRVTYGMGQLGTAIFGAFYAFLGAVGGWNLFLTIKFYYQYYTAKDKIAFLKGQLELSVKEKEKLAKFSDKAMIKEAKKMLPEVCPDLKMDKKQWKHLFDEVGDKELASIGRAFMERKMHIKHETRLKRVTSGDCVKLINEINDVTVLTGAKKTEILEKVQKAWNVKLVINSLLALLGAAGLAATVAGFIFTGGIGAVIVTLVWILAVIIPMSIVDGYSYYTDMKDGTPGKYDKAFLIFSSLVCVAAMAVSLALTSVFSFAILPIVMTVVLGLVWLATNAFTYWNIVKAEERIAKEGKKTNALADVIQSWLKAQTKPLQKVHQLV